MNNLETLKNKLKNLDVNTVAGISEELKKNLSAASLIEINKKYGVELSLAEAEELLKMLGFNNDKESIELDDDALSKVAGGSVQHTLCSIFPFIAGCDNLPKDAKKL